MIAALAIVATPSIAQAADPATGNDPLGRPVFLVVVLALVSIVPIVFMATTAFVKISTVLQITRNALGAQNVPSNTVLLALSAVLAAVAMAPVGSAIATRGEPLLDKAPTMETPDLVREGAHAVGDPLRTFMEENAIPRERARFFALARAARKEEDRASVTDRDVAVIVPAFVVSELERAFALGVAVFLPFLVLDLVVANILVAAGLSSLSPTQVSLPLKLLLFLAVDGWGLLARALVSGYRF
jgi:type III secretion protein R